MDRIDRWARRAAGGTPTAAQDAVVPASPVPAPSRRDFLKKAGVIGGLAWSVPVLQTVMAPAASASVGLVAGDLCTAPDTNTGICGDTSRCWAGVCGGMGAPCPTGICYQSSCSGSGGGHPQALTCGGVRAACPGGDSQCLAGLCTSGTCRRAVGGSCSVNSDCLTGRCTSNTCTAAAAGGTCRQNSDCVTNSCNTGTRVCNTGPVGATCYGNGDCAGGRPCSGRTGGPTTCGGPGATCSSNAQCTNGNCGDFGACGGLGATCSTSAQCRTAFGINLSCRSGECNF